MAEVSRPRALLVDDDLIVLEFLAQKLQGCGFTTDRAWDGVEALDKLAKGAYDVVLLDIDMPRLGGVDTLEGIKKKDPSIEVVMVTAAHSVNVAVSCMKKGAYDYVTKPFLDADLEAIVLRALEHRRLGRMLSELEQLSQMKTAFLSNVSHELRTPLAEVLGHVANLLAGAQGPLSTPQKEALQRVEAGAQKLLSVVNTLLDYARFSAEDAKAHLSATPLAPVAEKVLGEFAGDARRKGLALSVAIPKDLSARTDADLLTKLLRQLVSNGVKFTEKGGVRVEAAPDTARVLLSVRDTGIGIDPRDRALLFEEFRQSDASPTRARGGAGLGLAVAKKLALALGATLSYESEPGRGAVFTVALPR